MFWNQLKNIWLELTQANDWYIYHKPHHPKANPNVVPSHVHIDYLYYMTNRA